MQTLARDYHIDRRPSPPWTIYCIPKSMSHVRIEVRYHVIATDPGSLLGFGELSPVPNTPFISQTALETPSWSSAATDSKVLELVPNDSGQTSVETNNVIDAVRPYSIQDIERVPGRVMYSPSTGQPLGVPESVQLPSCVPRIKKTFKRSTPIACFFCRKRKIACGGPPKNSSDKTCG